MSDDPKPGWYVVIDPDGRFYCRLENAEGLPPGLKAMAIDDLLRDATRYRHIRAGSQLCSRIRNLDGETLRTGRADAKIDAEIAQGKGISQPKIARERGE